ncbi:LysR family transcriptional regulator [Actinomadura rupiterrae]|uniref:LysR family transcriptional regulator n=1 Tax=Actinomadura rupiterrae TaxID=559627 RepID=UPI0020A5AF3B|nr:LysR family transcriptional regulator [Actinomadura rupiterrae]MCP2341117.1 DNA-binding transcriptional LysR family regulator [Actinomadura rupiterrae]
MTHRNPNGPLDLAQLRTFLAVYRAGSLTAAARLVGLSQPTVTTQLRALEERTGRQLFERLPRGVTPTPAADDLAARLAGPMDALEAVAGGGAADEPAPEPPVLLAGPAEFLAGAVVPTLGPLLDRGVRLRITAGLAEDLLAGLRAGRFDLVVSTIRPRGRALVSEPLADETFVLVGSPEWAARLDRELLERDGPAALAGAPLISYADDLPILRRYWRHVFDTRLTAEPALVVPDLRAIKAAAVAGLGVTVLPRYLCLAELADGSLLPLLDPEDPPINTAFLVQRSGAFPLPHAGLVREHLLRVARSC